jgi:peptide/nickel transport system substrate-binding protein
MKSETRRSLGWLAALLAIAAAVSLSACGSSTSSSAGGSSASAAGSAAGSGAVIPTDGAALPAKPGGTIKVGMPAGAIDHLEPTLWYFATSWEVAYATCTPLVTFPDTSDPAGVKVVPGLAEKPQISADGREYTFTLRPGVEFATGKPNTGADIAYTFDRMLSPQLASPADSFFGGIVGAEEVIEGKAKTVSGIVAKGNKVTFKLERPIGSFLYRMTLPFTCPVPVGTPDKPLEDGSALLTGPYVVKSYTPDRSLVLDRNPHFDTAVLGNRQTADEIELQLGVEPTQAGPLVLSGGLASYGAPISATDAQQALANESLSGRVFVTPLPGTTYLWLNNEVEPFDNVKVRQAVNYAIDREAVVRVWGGPSQAAPTDQILPPGMPNWSDAEIYPSDGDLKKAEELMNASGVKTPVSVELRTLSDQPGYAQAAQVIQAELQPLGIEVSITTVPDAVNSGIISVPKNKVAMGINTWTQDYPYPDDFIGVLLNGNAIVPSGNQNYAAFDEPAVNSKIAALEESTTPDTSARWNTLDREIIGKYAPWAPLINPTRTTLFAEGVCGAVMQPVYQLDLAKLGRCS